VTFSTIATRCGRAILLRCPNCGASGILAGWFKLKSHCPNCQLALDRGETDFWLGAYAINVVAAEAVAAAGGLLVLWIQYPAATLASATAIVLAVALPFTFFPFTRVLWLALDMSFRDSTR
jgi:uncharacterized protein (DUF983 family)